MIQFLGRGVAGFVLLLVSYIAVGGVVSAAGAPKPRGQMVEIEPGRTLRLVCEGERSDRPIVWLESGAFGLAADWGAVQEALTAAGWRSCAYDRAGMGYSPPGPKPRDGLAIVEDFEKLVAASGEPGPYVLVGHSMAGLRLREFAGRNPDKVAGLVLVDAAGPEAAQDPRMQGFIKAFANISKWAARGASLGLYKPLVHTRLGDKIDLPPAAKAEKGWAFANGRHNRTAAEEISLWAEASAQASQQPPFDPKWPVAVVTAGPVAGRELRKAMQEAPARRSEHGLVDHVEGATHTLLIGRRFADHIVRAVTFVADARAKG
ncbi:alpha/beta fold hydrolase [Caulobacter sp. BP25]|uniref:alpha/beta fold hydrolase n=1 Tax=Caulobacter sp. BP25 TaxID=2048900 RepID=UPI000C12B9B1|nr:alpha/beta fold hydrolase [Caulobacter sp. BP25]PHY18234.1 alpha/beta hydrolase [Caulobacter sp. BP25]